MAVELNFCFIDIIQNEQKPFNNTPRPSIKTKQLLYKFRLPSRCRIKEFFDHRRWDRYVVPKRRRRIISLRRVISQNTADLNCYMLFSSVGNTNKMPSKRTATNYGYIRRPVGKVSRHFEYLENRSCDLDVTWHPVREDLTVYP